MSAARSTLGRMDTTISADGTRIAYETFGSGRPVVIVGGAFSTASDGVPLADALAAPGLHGVTGDRSARGSSGDTAPYAPEREAEDVAAVVDAVGGRAALLGHSSGAVLALLAASRGAQVSHLFLSEPPLGFGKSHLPADLPETLQSLLDEGRPEEVVTIFRPRCSAAPRRSPSLRSHLARSPRRCQLHNSSSCPSPAGIAPILPRRLAWSRSGSARSENDSVSEHGVDV